MAAMTDPMLLEDARARVLDWFGRAGRDLPWRATRDPYLVLVAEVLAQQTQAARAGAAWPRFLERFPDVVALAAATPAEVLRAWQGLGYNRRALALRATAQAVVERGGWPDTVEGLVGLPGIGPYTARAVACFALGLEVAPVDTNVARVLARALTGGDPSGLGPAARQKLADVAMPPGRAWEWSSALAGARPGGASAPAEDAGPVPDLRPPLARCGGAGPGRRAGRAGPGGAGRGRGRGRRRPAGRVVRRAALAAGGRGADRPRS